MIERAKCFSEMEAFLPKKNGSESPQTFTRWWKTVDPASLGGDWCLKIWDVRMINHRLPLRLQVVPQSRFRERQRHASQQTVKVSRRRLNLAWSAVAHTSTAHVHLCFASYRQVCLQRRVREVQAGAHRHRLHLLLHVRLFVQLQVSFTPPGSCLDSMSRFLEFGDRTFNFFHETVVFSLDFSESWTLCSTSCWCGTTARSPSGRASSSATARGASPLLSRRGYLLFSLFFFYDTEASCRFRIKGWWVFHHYVSTFLSGVMLTW